LLFSSLSLIACFVPADNILIEKTEPISAYLIDFGFVKARSDGAMSYESGTWGTQGYGDGSGKSSVQSDIYALGVTILEFMLRRRLEVEELQLAGLDTTLKEVTNADSRISNFVRQFFLPEGEAKTALQLLDDEFFQVDFVDESNEWYCICGRPKDYDVKFIVCQNCMGPMHLTCSQVPLAWKDTKKFLCKRLPQCRKLLQEREQKQHVDGQGDGEPKNDTGDEKI
jgi:serine/threonine protein kinase